MSSFPLQAALQSSSLSWDGNQRVIYVISRALSLDQTPLSQLLTVAESKFVSIVFLAPTSAVPVFLNLNLPRSIVSTITIPSIPAGQYQVLFLIRLDRSNLYIQTLNYWKMRFLSFNLRSHGDLQRIRRTRRSFNFFSFPRFALSNHFYFSSI